MPAGGTISSVHPKSLGARVGLAPGDELLAINGQPLRDVIDVQFAAAEERLTLRIRRQGRERTLRARRRYDEPLGLEFTRPTFDSDIRRCTNRCDFCFVAQMPPGLRRSLYIRDDDYRHSFLFGNYITLTNLDEADWQRIGEQHLSPLYVSVHATDPDLRRRILRAPDAPDVREQLERLAGLGIEVHTQLVLAPGRNDGPHLDRSIADLAERYPAVASVSVVPVGLTRYHRGGCRVYSDDEMRVVHDQVAAWQERLLPRLGVRFVYLSDEWYLRLGLPVPPAEAYDGLDLTENGVGLARQFLSSGFQGSGFQVSGFKVSGAQVSHAQGQSPNLKPETLKPETLKPETLKPETLKPDTLTLVTGTLFAPLLREVTAHLPGVEVVPVVNHFFGETVTVAGLLTGRDVIEQLRDRPLGERVILPAAMFGGPAGQTLDEMTPEQIGHRLHRSIHLSP